MLQRVTLKDEPLPKVDTPVTATPADDDDIYGATPRQSAKLSPSAANGQMPAEYTIVSGPAQESITEPDSKFAGMPTNMAAEPKPELKVDPPSQQTFIVDVPPVITGQTAGSPESAAPTISPEQIGRSKSPMAGDEPPSPTESDLHRTREDEEDETSEGNPVNDKPVQSSAEIFEEHKRKQLIRDMEEKIAIMPTQEMLEPPKKNDDIPMMSATSYPGQEWNPYGEGFEDYDE